MNIAHELERSRLLGTTRPTDEEIVEALKEAQSAAEEADYCDECVDTKAAAEDVMGCSAADAEDILTRLLYRAGYMDDQARQTAQSFIETIKASVKTP